MGVGILHLRLSRLTDWNLTPAAIVKTVLHGFSVGKGLNLGRKTQAVPDSWSIYCLRVWIAPFRDLRYRAADARLCVIFCGLAGCCTIPWSAKVRPAYRASNVPSKTARNEKSSVPRSIRSTGLSYVVDFCLHSHRCFFVMLYARLSLHQFLMPAKSLSVLLGLMVSKLSLMAI